MPGIGLDLLFNVASDDVFVGVNYDHEVAFRPNTVGAPIDLLEKWKLGLHAASSVRLDDADYLTDGPDGRN